MGFLVYKKIKNYYNFLSYSFFVVLSVDLLATSGDITMTWTSPMLSKFYSNDSSINPLPKPISKHQDAMIVSFINIGAAVGGLPFGYISDNFGRKIGLLTIGCFHLVAYLSMAFSKCVELFYFGRLLGGIAVGGGYTLLPLYIAEIAAETKRGAYSVTLGIFWGFGNFLPYLIGPFISVKVFNLIDACFPVSFLIIFSLVGTETPFYLIGANEIEKAEKVLMKIRSKDRSGVQEELNYIKTSLDNEEKSITFKSIFKNPGISRGFIIAMSLISFQQLAGINAVTSYLQPIFEASGTDLPSDVSSLIVGAAIFGFSLPAPYVTGKFGRKTLLLFSEIGMGLCLVLLSVFFYIHTRTDIGTLSISWLPLTSLLAAVFFFQMGLACLPWTISSELFPKNVKKLSASATSTSCWVTSFLVTLLFNDMTASLGTDGTILIFGLFSFLAAVFTVWYVPETRGKTFVEIQKMLQQ